MSVVRTVNAATLIALSGPALRPADLVEFDFASGFVRLWTGTRTLTWNALEWTGVGQLGGIEVVEETVEMKAASVAFKLSGVDPAIVAILEDEASTFQGRAVTIYRAHFDEGYRIVGEPTEIWSGRMDRADAIEGKLATVSITAGSELERLTWPTGGRLTDADQKARFPGDRGLEYVAALQNMKLRWGS